MSTRQWVQCSGAAAGFILVSALGTASAASTFMAPYTTPPGIILVDVAKLMDAGSAQFLWRRLGDAEGNPLYTRDEDPAGKSSCYDECAKEFPPYVAKRGSKAFGDWTIVSRKDRMKQWAYQGKPLYRYSGEDPRGEPQGARFQLQEDPAWHDPGSKVYSPKAGWRRAAYSPEKTAVMPTSVELEALAAADGVGFVSASSHTTVYSAPAALKLSATEWHPLRASALAVPVGDFTIFTREDDGTRQWAYHGEALYTYAHDNAPGEVNGTGIGDKSVRPALAYRYFNPNGIQVSHYPGRGPLLTTKDGESLYTVSRFHATYGGLEAPGGYYISYNELKSQGTVGCEGDCTMTWKPVVADRKAQSSGFWELIDRPNGARQWMYKGSPVYTYVGDKKPGDIEGNNRYVIAFGGPNGEITYADAGNDPRSVKHHLGNLTMVAAVGMAPGHNPTETPTYVAGQGYVATRAEGGRGGYAPPRAGGGLLAPNDPAVEKKAPDADTPNGVGGTVRLPDHGAGFYWHVIQPYF